MSKYKVNQENFLKDVADHKMNIIQDNGVYRHVRFKAPGTGCQHFNIVTYPGYLVYSGDMGTFVFERTFDMFKFFNQKMSDGINPHYWMEKVEADGRRDGCEEHCQDLVMGIVTTYLEDFFENIEEHYADGDHSEEYDTVDEFKAALKSEVMNYFESAELDEYRFCNAFGEFESEVCPKFNFSEWYEHTTKDYTARYLWCCYAIVYAIETYNARPQGNVISRFVQYVKGFKNEKNLKIISN